MKTKLLLILVVLFLFFVSSVAAIEVCCEKLKANNNYCVYTNEEDCDSKFKDAAVSCEQTSFCKTGCCYSSDEGECYKNVARAQCASMEGTTWTDSANCEIPQCQKGCCVIGSQGFFVTEVKCKLETSKYGNVTMKWSPDIISEPECQAVAKSQDQGCCVATDACVFTTREKCPTAGTVPTSVNQTREGFYQDMLCSNDRLSCGCAKQTNTGCYDDDVYWFDSCSNRENVYSSDKAKSYNNGYVIKSDEVCNAPATGDPNCGNCDYAQGSICRKAKTTRPAFGESICSTTKCSTTYNDGLSANAGTPKKNGESWCLYDSAVGKAQDPVGSRHYRHLCINGEEMNEPCMDYREEICIQGILGEDPADTLKAFTATGKYVEAACRDNRWEDCIACNEDKVDVKKCCENEALRDCYYLPAGGLAAKGGPAGYCTPQVPPGLQFWPSETAELPSSSTRSSAATTAAVTTGSQTGAHGSASGPGSNAESVCSQANMECLVKWHIGGTGRIGIGGIGTQSGWECVQNCQCTEPDWVIGGNNLCKVLGDCGAKFNYLGKVTMEGYANTASNEKEKEKGLYFNGHKLTEKDVGDWELIATKGEALDEAGGFLGIGMGGLMKSLGTPVLTLAASGLVTSLFMGGTFMGGATGGLNILSAIFTKTTMAQAAITSFGPQIGTTYVQTTAKGTSNLIFDKSGVWIDQGTGTKLSETASKEMTKEYAASSKATVGTGGNIMSVVNTIMWLYTIYQVIDLIFADDKEETYTMSCGSWQAPEGGSDCEKCNADKEKQCSLYRCKSLGQNCYLVNQGSSEEKCINLNPNDVNAPIINSWPEVIPQGFTITPTTDEGNKGYKINEKIGPYDSITLGIKTDEPSQCKFIDKVGTDFDEMAIFFGDGQYVYEHQMSFVMPPEFTTKEAIKKLGDTYNLYIRCKDTSGNKNEKDYFIRFTLKPEPDMTAPKIEKTSIENNAYISYNSTNTGFSVYTNERANCKYDTVDKDYSLMSTTFECSTSPFTVNSALRGMYECSTKLDLTNNTKYEWYIRCKDTANNENRESYKFKLTPTLPLEIISVGPTGTFYEPEVTLKVATAQGAENGKATCAYSDTDDTFGSMVVFLNTNAAVHEQPLTPGTGEFMYYVKCLDAAGNIATGKTTFTVDVDTTPPKIVFIYVTASNYLHMEMDEASNCEYSNATFSYGAGLPMTGSGTAVHELSIVEKMYHVACQDTYANEAKFVVYP
jgi:hypothetical protein